MQTFHNAARGFIALFAIIIDSIVIDVADIIVKLDIVIVSISVGISY